MKKILLNTGVLLLTVAMLAACGNSKDTSSKADNSSSSSVQKNSESSSKTEKSTVNEENLNQAVKQFEEKFNDKEKLVEVNVKNDVADDTSNEPHSVIEVKIVDEESRKNTLEMQNAIDSNSATDVQKTAISGIQLNVEEVAKTLENEHDVIKFVVPATNGNRVIAMATKNENFIPIVE
jgi:maltose-binding protein MalE